MKTKSRLFLVEDHAILRDGLRTILADYQEFEIVGEAADGLEALQLCETCCPDLVLLDLTLPKLDGIEVLRKMKQQWPAMAVLVLTMHRSLQLLEDSLVAGANGYCLKDSRLEELVGALRVVIQGQKYISRAMLCFHEKPMPGESADVTTSEENAAPLTGREKEILRLVAQGYTNPQIAKTLSISVRTVDNHCTRLRNKVGVHSKQALTAYAHRAGLVQ